jgi:kumamolisin
VQHPPCKTCGRGRPFGSQAVHTDTSAIKADSGSSNACEALSGLDDACHTTADFANEYGLSSLYKKTDGAGQTIAIVTLAALDVGAPEYYWDNIDDVPDTGRSVTVDNVDGGPGAPSYDAGTGETDLDVEQSGGLAPGANIIVYQAPNTDYGFADAFFQAASQNIASTVSASWLESETYLEASIASDEESPGYEAAFDEAFLEMAAQGQSGFIATVDVRSQRAWGWDYLWQPLATITGTPLATEAESAVTGTGGGFSTIESTPSYQQGVSGTDYYHAVQYLTPTDYQTVVSGFPAEPTEWSFDATPSVTTGHATGRAVPDVSTDADPYTGYLEYSPSFAVVRRRRLPDADGRLGRHQLRRAAAERLDRCHRRLPRPPGGLLEPGDLLLRRIRQRPVHADRRGGHQRPGRGLQPDHRPGHPRPVQAGG